MGGNAVKTETYHENQHCATNLFMKFLLAKNDVSVEKSPMVLRLSCTISYCVTML